MKKHTIKITVTGVTLEEDGEYFRIWIKSGKDKAHFQATSWENAVDILDRLSGGKIKK